MTQQAKITGTIVSIVVVVVGFLWWLFIPNEMDVNSTPNQNPTSDVTVQDEYDSKIIYGSNPDSSVEQMQADCEARDGIFNECGSSCAPDAEVCVEICAYTCELVMWDKITNDVSNWETYNNVEIGFAVRYPEGVEVNENSEKENSVQFMLEGLAQEDNIELFDGFSVTFVVESYTNATSLRSYVQQEFEELTAIGTAIVGVSQKSLAHLKGYTYTVETVGEITHIYVPLNSREAFHVSYMVVDLGNKGYENMLQNMFDSVTILRK